MYLLNNKQILENMKEGSLGIEKFDPKLLLPTYYYFRLGDWVGVWNEKDMKYHYKDITASMEKTLVIPPRGYALIKSLESFRCSKKILGIFSHMSTLPRRGLRLNHSLTIDPNFVGYLEMGLENLLNKETGIQYSEVIGKILFFDVTDSSPIPDIIGTISERDYKRRETLKKPEHLE